MLTLKVIHETERFLLTYGYEMIVIHKFKYKYKFYIIKSTNIIVYEHRLNPWMYLKKGIYVVYDELVLPCTFTTLCCNLHFSIWIASKHNKNSNRK